LNQTVQEGKNAANSGGSATRAREFHGSGAAWTAQGNDGTGLVTIDLGKDHFAAAQDITVTNSVAGDLLAAASGDQACSIVRLMIFWSSDREQIMVAEKFEIET
jgi:hypothetical protein